jgi:hypothetical protein
MGGTRKTLHANGLRISTRCETVEQFVGKFYRFCEDCAIFIPGAKRQVGIDTAFSFDLVGGQSVLCGLGTVLDHFETNDNRFGRPGIVLGISRLQASTKHVFDDMLVERAVKASARNARNDAGKNAPPARHLGAPSSGPDATPSPGPDGWQERPPRARLTTDPFGDASGRLTPTPQAKTRAVTSAVEIMDSVAVKAATVPSPKPRTRTAPIAVITVPARATGPISAVVPSARPEVVVEAPLVMATLPPPASERPAQLANASSTIPRGAIGEEPSVQGAAAERVPALGDLSATAPRLADSSRAYSQVSTAVEPALAVEPAVPATSFASPPRSHPRAIPGRRRLWRIGTGLLAVALIGLAAVVVGTGSDPRPAQISAAQSAVPLPSPPEAAPANDPPAQTPDRHEPLPDPGAHAVPAPSPTGAASEEAPRPQQPEPPAGKTTPPSKKPIGQRKTIASKPAAKKTAAKKPAAKKPAAKKVTKKPIKKPVNKKPGATAKCASLDCM